MANGGERAAVDGRTVGWHGTDERTRVEGMGDRRPTGDPVRVTQGEVTFLPFSVAEELVSGEKSAAQWRALSEEAGIADVDLGRPS